MRLVRDGRLQLQPVELKHGAGFLLLRIARPWRDAAERTRDEAVRRPGQRLFIESACGWNGTDWLDGPLVHVLADGSIASYLPSGGPGELVVPDTPQRGLVGVSWDDALRLEGEPGSQLLRCFAAEMAARLPLGDLRFHVAAPDLRAACLLAVMRKVRYDARIEVHCQVEPAAGFRRFAQNAGLLPGKGGGLELEDFGGTVRAADIGPLAAALNRFSALLPAGLIRSYGDGLENRVF
jgi:hypothetical protein